MKTRKITVEVTRYYSKTELVSIEVDTNLVNDDLVDYLTNDSQLDLLYENSLSDGLLIADDTKYEWHDEINEIGGHL